MSANEGAGGKCKQAEKLEITNCDFKLGLNSASLPMLAPVIKKVRNEV